MSRADYEKFFKDADADGSGELTFSELYKMLQGRGYKGGEAQIKEYFKEVDTSGDKKISMQEYLVAMGQVPPEQHGAAAMRSVFNSFDKDGSGEIDKSELRAIFAEVGKSFSDAELERMIQLADVDGSGTLNAEEFIEKIFGC